MPEVPTSLSRERVGVEATSTSTRRRQESVAVPVPPGWQASSPPVHSTPLEYTAPGKRSSPVSTGRQDWPDGHGWAAEGGTWVGVIGRYVSAEATLPVVGLPVTAITPTSAAEGSPGDPQERSAQSLSL